MKHSKRAILKALRIIKSECEETRCEGCPFGGPVNGHERCLLRRAIPLKWELNDNREAWKALRVGDLYDEERTESRF